MTGTGERTGDSPGVKTGERTDDRPGDSISDRTGWDLDRTSDMIGNRAWDRMGPGLVTGLVKGLVPVLMTGLVTRTGDTDWCTDYRED
jgi:hypothetical protein